MAQVKQTIKKVDTRTGSAMWFDRLSSMKRDLACIGFLLIVIFFIFGKIIFSNMMFSDSGDTAAADSWAIGIQHVQATEHIDPLWMPYLFSGMPVFSGLLFPHSVNYFESLIQIPGRLLFLNADLSWFVLHYFLMGVFMYMLTRRLGFSQLPSLLAAVTLMLNPAAMSLAQEGHGSKLITLSYVPLLFMLTYNLFQKRNILSLGLLAGATGTLFLSRHPQIAFYGLLLVGSYMAYELFLEVRQRPVDGGKKVLLFAAALAIGFAIYSYEFLPTQEYATYSIRGGGGEPGAKKGLDYDYATNWSYHPLETLTYIVPSVYGFSSNYLIDVQGTEQVLPLYWGWMPFTNWPAYIGILPVLLGFIALINKRDKLAWFLALFSIFIMVISFGKYFGIVYDLFFNYVPYFNKFRAPVLIHYIMPITFGVLAASGVSYLGDLMGGNKDPNFQKTKKNMKMYALVMAGIVVAGFVGKSAMYAFTSGFMYSAPVDRQYFQQFGQEAVNLIHEKRFEVFWNYFEWCAFQAAVLFGLIAAYYNGKIQRSMMMFAIVVLVTIDLTMIDQKFITPKAKSEATIPFQGDATVQRLSAESDSSLFRVFPTWGLTGFDNSLMNYHLQMITGYSPAKLKIYQETIDSCFMRGNRKVFNMLNVKYYLAKQGGKDGAEQVAAQLNPDCLPRAWFTDSFVVSSSKAQTFGIMNSATWEPRHTAILEKQPEVNIGESGSGVVSSFKYGSSHITMTATTSKPALLVVSEIYYPGGWKTFIDGVETETYKTNYILRSVVVPSGTHTIEMKFNPESYEKGLIVSESAWALTGILILGGLLQLPWVKGKIGLKKKDQPKGAEA